MGDYIEFKGRTAYLNSTLKPKSPTDKEKILKYILTFENIGDLELLLSMDGLDKISVNGKEEPYSKFKEEVLKKTHKIYPTKDAKFIDELDDYI